MEDIVKSYKRKSWHDQDSFSRILKMASYGIEAIRDPTKGDIVAKVGDLSGTKALKNIRSKMLADKTGRQILEERPRIKEDSVFFDRLGQMDENSVGYHYWKFMAKYDFTPDERPVATYVPDMELAYIMQRYKECHDFLHTLLGMGISIEDELAVKAFEMVQTGIPMCAFSLITGPFLLKPLEMKKLYIDYLPWVTKMALTSRFFMNIYFEKHFEQDVDEFRRECGVSPWSK
nr:putative ubiquinone bioshynthesis protein COQ4 [Moneuplotes crassus]